MRLLFSLISISLLCLASASAQQSSILGKSAPKITVDEWVSIPTGEKIPSLAELKGKVVYLYFFQSWCPGCHSSGFPTLKEVQQKYLHTEDVQCIAIQTVFEGFHTNTPKRALAISKKYTLQGIPFGHAGSSGKPAKIMRDFQTRGTPWTVIIDKKGIVRYSDFHISPRKAQSLINRLRKNS